MAFAIATRTVEFMLCIAGIAALTPSIRGHKFRGLTQETLSNEGIPVGDVIKPWGWIYNNPNGKKGRDIVMIHTEKAGGSNSICLVKALAAASPGAGADVHVVHEHSALPSELQGSDYFKIGMIREPCSYYASEYAWGFHPGGGWLSTHLRRENATHRDSLYQGDAGPKHYQRNFARWLKFISGLDDDYKGAAPKQRCGLLTTRVYGQALQPTAVKEINDMYKEMTTNPKTLAEYNEAITCDFMDRENPEGSETGHCPCPLGNCAGNAPPEWHEACDRGMKESDLSKIDCWVRTETLKDDLKECMDKFSAHGGLVGNFDEVIGPSRFGAYNHEQTPQASVYKSSCSTMFDPELARFVYEGVDASFVKRFGYTECCKPHPSATMPTF